MNQQKFLRDDADIEREIEEENKQVIQNKLMRKKTLAEKKHQKLLIEEEQQKLVRSNIQNLTTKIYKDDPSSGIDMTKMIDDANVQMKKHKQKEAARKKAAKEKREKEKIKQRFTKAGMQDENATEFAQAILDQDGDTSVDLSDEEEKRDRMLAKASKLTTETSEDDEDEEENFDGLEGTYNLSSTYFDIFDNILRKYVSELNQKDELRMQLAKELGK